MRIERIELQNFRGFERFDMDLHPEVTLLVGENGTGKTALIDALAFTVGKSAPYFGTGFDFKQEDIRITRVSRGGLIELVPASPFSIAWTCSVLGRTFRIGLGGEDPDGGFEALMRLAAEGHAREAGLKHTTLPVILLAPAHRAFSRSPGFSEDASHTFGSAYNDWRKPVDNQRAVVSWFRRYTIVGLQEGETVPQLRAIREAVLAVVPKLAEIAYNIRHEELRLRFDDGRVLGFQRLSDGYRNILAMVADIAWRCAVLNPHLEERATLETEGVVLIDELELHLHPRWQREILGTLRKAFPRIQFIATTHSPQVIASAEPEWIRILTGGETAITPSHVHGRDTNALLEDIMGVPSRPEWAKEELDKLFAAIDRGELDEARRLVTALETALGPDDADLTRARFMLEMESL